MSHIITQNRQNVKSSRKYFPYILKYLSNRLDFKKKMCYNDMNF